MKIVEKLKELEKEMRSDIDMKINFINENSQINIRYYDIEENSSCYGYDGYWIDDEYFGYFNLSACLFFKSIEDINIYLKFKNKLDELYFKIKLKQKLENKLQIKETTEKRIKI